MNQDSTLRRIRAWIDGVLFHDTEDRLPIIESLYYSTSHELSTGDVIVKVVNMQEKEISGQVVLAELPSTSLTVKVNEMSGFALDDENTFASPERVRPNQREFHTEGCSFHYEFPKHSITVFRVNLGFPSLNSAVEHRV